MASGELDAAEATLAEMRALSDPPPTDEDRQQLDGWSEKIASARKAEAARRQEELTAQREAALESARTSLAQGDLVAAQQLVAQVLALSPTVAERKAAGQINDEIERVRERQRGLRTLVRLLGSELRADVSSARSQLLADPQTATGLLLEAVRDEEKPNLVRNALEVLRRMKRPAVALPAMVGVLSRPAQEDNWDDAVSEIRKVNAPGAGEPLLNLALEAESPRQRIAALTALTDVVDPPARTFVALLPLIAEDGPALAPALSATIHAVRLHGQEDFTAQRGVGELSEEDRERLASLPARLTAIAESAAEKQPEGEPAPTGNDSILPAAQSAQVLLLAARLVQPQVLPAMVHGVSAQAPDGPAAAALDGVWASTELATMWRHPAAEKSVLTLDLGEERTVTAVRIWNFNEAGGAQRGWRDAEVYVSQSDRALTPVAKGIVARAPGVADPPDYSITIPVPYVRGRYIKLGAQSIWQTDNTHTGLSEVQVLGF